MSSATQIGTYIPTLAILHVPNATLANWPCRMSSYRTWGAYAAGDGVNVPV